MIYCVVPEALADELYDKLVDYYKDDPNVKVIIDRRSKDRRKERDRRAERRDDAAAAAADDDHLARADAHLHAHQRARDGVAVHRHPVREQPGGAEGGGAAGEQQRGRDDEQRPARRAQAGARVVGVRLDGGGSDLGHASPP